MATFWSQATTEPKQKHRFKISITNLASTSGVSGGGGDVIWYAKSVNLPSFEINQGEYQLGNHKFKYPGILTWGDITLTFVDPASRVSDLLKLITNAGYDIPATPDGNVFSGHGDKGMRKEEQAEKYIGGIMIQPLNADGTVRETYRLQGAFIKSMNLGDLSYDSEDLVELQMVIAYDHADINVET